MKQSQLYMPTLKEVPKDADIISHQLLLKAGYVHQTASGIYSYLPMATKILNNIEQIIREEIDGIGGNEVKLPFLEPAEFWKKTGRWQSYGAELFRVQDRHGREFALAPTHEEVATELIKNYLNSYKKLPINVYQIQTKMRDERRPRFGLLRGREFIMMDGYTFNENEESLRESYDKYYEAYIKILNRLGVKYKVVKADNGSMGGLYSDEFMALSEVGEDFIAYEEGKEEAYNVEIAPIYTKYEQETEEIRETTKLHTPNVKTIEALKKEYNLSVDKLLKAICYDVDGQLVVAFIMGNREVEEVKVANICKAQTDVEPAGEELLEKHNIVPGFIGPKELPKDIKVLIDQEVKYKVNLICGANEKDYHLENVTIGDTVEYFDIRKAEEGDLISKDGDPIKIAKGIEVGHIFALGDKYTKGLDVKFLSKEQKNETPVMGSYGIGVSRLLSTIIEQSNDENGIILPKCITPYDVHILPLDYGKNEEQTKFTNELIKTLKEEGITYLLDDRQERPGIKFKDADLIGLPYQVVIGKEFSEGILEFKNRKTNEKEELQVEEIIKKLK